MVYPIFNIFLFWFNFKLYGQLLLLTIQFFVSRSVGNGEVSDDVVRDPLL